MTAREVLVGVTLALTPASSVLASPSRPVAPGDVELPTRIETRCPTFSWTVGDPSSRVELAVFRYETMENGAAAESAELVWSVTLPAGSVSWTPAADRCLDPGLYGWSVRSEGSVSWSAPLAFEVGADEEVDLESAARRIRGYLDEGGSLDSLFERLDAKADAPLAAEPPGNGAPVGDRPLALGTPEGDTGGISAPEFEYSSPKMYRHRVSGFDFWPAFNYDEFRRVSDYFYKNSIAVDRFLYAPLSLPEGALMKSIVCYHYDNEPDDSAIWTTDLRRRDLVLSLPTTVATVVNDSSGASTAIHFVEEDILFNGTITNVTRSYFLRTRFEHDFGTLENHSQLRFYGCIIDYELSEPSSN